MAKILAIGAHPDDIEYYAGGTLAKMVEGGDEVTFVVATDGRRGSFNGTNPRHLAKMRRLEQEEAAKAIGVKKVIHLNYKDGSLEENIKRLKKDLLKILLSERPEIIFTFDPQKQYVIHEDFHPDHRVLAVASLDVILIDSTLPAKSKVPIKRPQIYLYNAHTVNTKVDITKFRSKKEAAVASFKSQMLELKGSQGCIERFQVYTRG